MDQIKQWYSELESSEQRIVMILGILFILVILIFGLLMPINQTVDSLQTKVSSSQNSVDQWKQSIPILRANRGRASSNQSLNSVVTSSTRQFNLNVSRVQEKGEDEMQVWLDNVVFNDCLNWISQLEKRYKVKVASINIRNKDRNGLINLDVKLQKG